MEARKMFMVEYNSQKLNSKYVERLKGGLYTEDVRDVDLQFKSYLGVDFVRFTNSGTSSLMLSLMSLGLDRDCEIIGPSYSHPAWLNACRFLGYNNITFVDVRENTLSMDPDGLRRVISNKTGAVFFVNMNGYIGNDLFEVNDICRGCGVYLIEDSCNAFGQQHMKVKTGTVGHMGCYSFGTPKILTSGEGGLICTNDQSLHTRVDDLCYQGGWYRNNRMSIGVGGNFNMPPASRMLLGYQLTDIKELQRERHDIFTTYSNTLSRGYLNSYTTDEPTGYPMNILLGGDLDYIRSGSEQVRIDIRSGIYKSLGRFFGVECEVSEYIERTAMFLPVYTSKLQTEIVSHIL